MTHVDVTALAEAIGVPDTSWCHLTVDTDCILTAILRRSVDTDSTALLLAEALHALSIDPVRVADELVRVRPLGGPDLSGHRPTGRTVSTFYRATTQDETDSRPAAVKVLHALLGDDQGPAAEALTAVGVTPRQARQILGLREASPRHCGPMWPPTPNAREFDWGVAESRSGRPRRDLTRPMVQPPSPPPSTGCHPTAFVWTGEHQEMELRAERNGPVLLTVRSGLTEVTVRFDAHVAELLARHLMDFHAQLEMERWGARLRRRANRPPEASPAALLGESRLCSSVPDFAALRLQRGRT